MALYLKKTTDEILRQAVAKIQSETPITNVGPGSVARALTEAVTTELGNYYDILDFNIAQAVLSTASGSALDLLGDLYNVKRKTIGSVAAADQTIGSFYFYIDSPYSDAIRIPRGTRVFTDTQGYVGRQLSFLTNDDAIIPVGSTRAYVTLSPDFSDSVFTAGKDTITFHNYISPVGVRVKCTNPKPVAVTEGYEQDDVYRARIIKGIRVASAGTLEAVRFAALNVPGVRDVRIRQAPYGLGSFEALVISEEASLSNALTVNVRAAMDAVRPVGVTMFLRQPTLWPLDLSFTVTTDLKASTEFATLPQRAQLGVIRYLNTLLPGDTLVYNKLLQSIMDSSAIIKDVQITKFAPNGVDAIRRNYSPKEYQQITPGRIEVTVS